MKARKPKQLSAERPRALSDRAFVNLLTSPDLDKRKHGFGLLLMQLTGKTRPSLDELHKLGVTLTTEQLVDCGIEVR